MKLVPLNNKKSLKTGIVTHSAVVDDDDFEKVNKISWHLFKGTNGVAYARGGVMIENRGKKNVLMHRYIMDEYNIDVKIDHIDHNGLNNKKDNLRKCTKLENNRNKIKSINRKCSSQYLGVGLNVYKKRGEKYTKWIASIRVNGKLKTLGRFPYTDEGEVLAAKEYDKAARLYFKEFANPNFK